MCQRMCLAQVILLLIIFLILFIIFSIICPSFFAPLLRPFILKWPEHGVFKFENYQVRKIYICLSRCCLTISQIFSRNSLFKISSYFSWSFIARYFGKFLKSSKVSQYIAVIYFLDTLTKAALKK